MNRPSRTRARFLIPELAQASCVSLSEIDLQPQRVPRAKYAQLQRDKFFASIERALDACAASPTDADAVRLAVGVDCKTRPYRNLMSNLPMRDEAVALLRASLRERWVNDPPDRRWFIVHLITDAGNTLERDARISLGRLKRDFSKILIKLDVGGFGVIELQISDYPGGRYGRTINAHAHVIAYTDDPSLNVMAAQRRVCASTTLTSWLGAPTCVIQPIRNLAALDHWCSYLFKPPVQMSWLSKNCWKRSGFQTIHRDVDYLGALRLAEVLSAIELRGALFTRGKPLGDVARKLVRDVTIRQRACATDDEPDFIATFLRIWAGSRSGYQRQAPVVCTATTAVSDAAWLQSMADRFAAVAVNSAKHDAKHATRAR